MKLKKAVENHEFACLVFGIALTAFFVLPITLFPRYLAWQYNRAVKSAAHEAITTVKFCLQARKNGGKILINNEELGEFSLLNLPVRFCQLYSAVRAPAGEYQMYSYEHECSATRPVTITFILLSTGHILVEACDRRGDKILEYWIPPI